MHISHCLLQEYTRAIELHAFLLRRRLGDAPLASAPLLTYKSRFVERDLPSTSVISKCTCSSPTPGATQWSSLRRRNQRLDHSLPLPSAPAHLRGEIYVSATHCHFQPTCTSDTRSFPLMARSTSRPLTVTSSPPTLPMSDSTVNLNHMRCFALRYSSRSHGMHLDEHQIASLPSTLVTCFASRFATRPHRTGCTSVHLYRQF
mmetsp:Transcript_34449/g.81357  ORF Transcript_34449/g.81357 Transcript_34449/m.81357 type:complete len:203 (-) Transcript_34449:127-735(-)